MVLHLFRSQAPDGAKKYFCSIITRRVVELNKEFSDQDQLQDDKFMKVSPPFEANLYTNFRNRSLKLLINSISLYF